VQTSLWWIGLAGGKVTPEMLLKSSVLFGDIGRHHLFAQNYFPLPVTIVHSPLMHVNSIARIIPPRSHSMRNGGTSWMRDLLALLLLLPNSLHDSRAKYRTTLQHRRGDIQLQLEWSYSLMTYEGAK
jgi:hypothetical protein